MNFTNYLALFAFAGGAFGSTPYNQGPPVHPGPTFPTNVGCGEVNVFYTYVVYSMAAEHDLTWE